MKIETIEHYKYNVWKTSFWWHFQIRSTTTNDDHEMATGMIKIFIMIHLKRKRYKAANHALNFLMFR